MKQRNVSFWWVVKHRDGDYIGDNVDKHVQHQREAGRHMDRENAVFAAEWWEDLNHHVVKVHARIPEPKLPAWVTPLAFHYRHVQVWRLSEGVWEQYVFNVSTAHMRVTETIAHRRSGVTRLSGPWDPPVSVWAEAAARAAKMLRAMKREKKAGKK